MPKFLNDPVFSESSSTEPAVQGIGNSGAGVRGMSHSAQAGVMGKNDAPLPGGNGGWFESENGEGVRGWSKNPNHGGVVGTNTGTGIGVFGQSDGTGVMGESTAGEGVRGISHSAHGGVVGVNAGGGTAVYGTSSNGVGVWGTSETDRGVVGVANTATGVEGNSTSGAGVFGSSQTGISIHGSGGRLAGFFEGDVEVTGDIRLTNADCAEDFDIVCVEQVEPGTVMVIDQDAALRQSDRAYDKRVAGVISGAGKYKPAIVLDKQESSNIRMPIALMGKVYCKVDASYGAIEVGDLLTTSPTLGHAMKADDPLKAFGAVIGKALRPLAEGQGLIPILIALQ